VARHFFSAAEHTAWNGLPAAARAEGFFRLWTAKEAYVKARGDGLGHPSTRYTMSLEPGREGSLLVDELSPEAPQQWSVQAIALDGGYVASLASASSLWPRTCPENEKSKRAIERPSAHVTARVRIA
jgi:4'-phosphopantetheinyl transferase